MSAHLLHIERTRPQDRIEARLFGRSAVGPDGSLSFGPGPVDQPAISELPLSEDGPSGCHLIRVLQVATDILTLTLAFVGWPISNAMTIDITHQLARYLIGV